ncbi:MAG TPA: FGGY family carbohydrate kinase [Actinomycetota bacterium]|nr:FGGY family carbohydrate kinase [Actinomycetota bacterium]
MTDLLMGIDVGTTLCKAAVVTLDGHEVAHGQRPTPWTGVATGAEVDPHSLAEASAGAALEALAAAPDGIVRGIGVCSMGETGVMLDGRGEPIAPGIAWHDLRGGPEAERMARDLGAERFVRRTGLPMGSFWTAPKIAALAAERPEVAGGRRWLSVAEWIVRWLGGDEVAELSLASRTGFLDVSDVAWWPDALEWAGLSLDAVPPLVQAGTPAGRVSRVRELEGATLTVTGHDHPCASVGAGASGPDDVLDSCGTAEAILRSAAAPMPPDAMEDAAALGITVGRHVVPERLVVLGFFKAGMALKRFLRLVGVEDVGPERDELDRRAREAPSGALEVLDMAEDLHRVAGIGGEVSPAALWRAALEAAGHETARILDELASVAGPHGRLVVVGGWTRSETYRQIKRASVGACEIPQVVEAGARGAALFGGLAAGLFGSLDDFPRPSTTQL